LKAIGNKAPLLYDYFVTLTQINRPWSLIRSFPPERASGDLDFRDKEKSAILSLLNEVPAIVDINLNRPAVIPEISAACKGLIADFGSSDKALLDVIFGDFNPEGKLPFELPSSMEAVRNQEEDMPYDSENPLYPFGFGLSYKQEELISGYAVNQYRPYGID